MKWAISGVAGPARSALTPRKGKIRCWKSPILSEIRPNSSPACSSSTARWLWRPRRAA